MAAAAVFKIETGVFGLKLVDKAAVGYLPAWQSPGGDEVDEVTIADFSGTGGIAFQCQTTSAALTPSSNTSDDVTPPTMCEAEVTETIVGVTSFTLDATLLQDPHVSTGVVAFLVENDTKECYFYLGLGGDAAPPAAIGRVTLSAGAIGGEVRTTLTTDISLPCKVKPDFWFGTTAVNRVVKGDGTTVTVFAAGASVPPGEDEATAPTSDEV